MSLIGAFALTSGSGVALVGRRKTQALLAYLALSPAPAESRERLCGLLWSESSQRQAQTSLRQILHGAREVFDELGSADLRIGRSEVWIAKSAIEVDVLSILAEAERGGVHPLLLARTRLADQLLPDLIDVDPAFRSWLLVQREVFKQRLETLLEAALVRARTLSAIKPIATALLNLDPSNEIACRRLMLAYAEQGDVAGALKTYKGLWDLLQEEYDTEPSPQTQQLVARIKVGEPLPAGEAASAAIDEATTHRPDLGEASQAAESHSILLVPEFENGGLPEDRRYLLRGLRQDLVAKLVRFREWTVLDGDGAGADFTRAATRCFRVEVVVREGEPAPEGAAGVVLVLTIKALPHGRYVWSETCRLDSERWLEAEQRMVGRIALALNVRLSADRLASAARQPDVSLGTYERWLRGQHLLFSWSAADRARATALFRAIVDDEPGFAPVYGNLVQLENSEHIVFPGIMRTPERTARALDFAKKAVQLDPLDSRTQLSLAWCFAMSGRFDLAEIGYELALDLNAQDPWTLISAAHGLAYCGRFEDARATAARALTLDLAPSKPHWAYQVGIRFLCGDYDACLEAFANAGDVIANLPAWHAAALFHLGREDEAVAAGRCLLERVRPDWHGPGEPSDAAIARWVLQSFPIRHERDWARLRDGMAGARLPVPQQREYPA